MSTDNLPKIYTDGSCLKNPGGAGGWACLVLENGEMWSVVGSEPSTTNNRMELQAIIQALKFAQGNEYVVYTDSKWALKCATGEWQRKANLDLWKDYEISLRGRKIHYVWVRGHNGDEYNEIVDDLARAEAKSVKKIK